MNPLEAAYRATDYHVSELRSLTLPDRRRQFDGGIVLRIGVRSRSLDRLLTWHGQRTWAFVTAWNPFSQITPAEQNAFWQRDLESEILRRGWLAFAGQGQGEGWAAEASVLILGITESEAVDLGRTYRQAAVVVGSLGEPARLMWTAG